MTVKFKNGKLVEQTIYTIPVYKDASHEGTDYFTGYNLTFEVGADKRFMRREFSKFLKAFGIPNWRHTAKKLGFTELL